MINGPLLQADEVANAVYALLLREEGGMTMDDIVLALQKFYVSQVYHAVNKLITDGLVCHLEEGALELYPRVQKERLRHFYEL